MEVKMDSVILELQRDALNRNVPISDLLRKALIIAHKLGIKEFETWISKELNGYGDRDEVPQYRHIKGEIKVWNSVHYDWEPVIFKETKYAELLSVRRCVQTIAEIENLIEKNKPSGSFQMPFGKELEEKLIEGMNIQTQITLLIQETDLVRILDTVRTIVLNWSLKLEEDGVKGEGLSFTTEEKKVAEMQSYNINNFYGPINALQIQQQTENSIQISSTSPIDLELLKTFISKLRATIPQLFISNDKALELKAEVETVETQSKSPNPKPNIIKQSLSSIRRILEGAGGNIAAQLLIELGKIIIS